MSSFYSASMTLLGLVCLLVGSIGSTLYLLSITCSSVFHSCKVLLSVDFMLDLLSVEDVAMVIVRSVRCVCTYYGGCCQKHS